MLISTNFFTTVFLLSGRTTPKMNKTDQIKHEYFAQKKAEEKSKKNKPIGYNQTVEGIIDTFEFFNLLSLVFSFVSFILMLLFLSGL